MLRVRSFGVLLSSAMLASCAATPDVTSRPPTRDTSNLFADASPVRTITRTQVPGCSSPSQITLRGAISNAEALSLISKIETFQPDRWVTVIAVWSGRLYQAETVVRCGAGDRNPSRLQLMFDRHASGVAGEADWRLISAGIVTEKK